MAEEHVNSIPEIRMFFEKDSRPLVGGEFIAFWKSLTEQEKFEFQHAELYPQK